MHPTAVLFNGGVLKADVLRARVTEVLNSWLVQRATRDSGFGYRKLGRFVAQGAAYFGRVKLGGIRILGESRARTMLA